MSGHLILISGYSQSGKSSLASWLTTVLPASIHLEQDSYVLPEHEIPTLRNRTDWESPESIDWQRWNQRISKELKQNQYVLAEGLFVRHDKASVQNAALIIQLTIPYAIFLQRRKNDQRWGQELDWYLQHVWESHFKNKQKEKGTADMTFGFITQADYCDIYERIISLSFSA